MHKRWYDPQRRPWTRRVPIKTARPRAPDELVTALLAAHVHEATHLDASARLNVEIRLAHGLGAPWSRRRRSRGAAATRDGQVRAATPARDVSTRNLGPSSRHTLEAA